MLLAAVLGASGSGQALPDGGLDAKARSRLVEAYRTRPLSFEKNRGQTDPRVQFFARHGSSTLFLTSSEAVISLRQSALRMKWVGANLSSPAQGSDELPAKTNYLIGSDPRKWRNNVPTYARVQYGGIYPGVDLIYYGERGELEFDLALAPGADLAPVRMRFDGASKIEIDRLGDLVLRLGSGEVRFHQPLAYQNSDAGRVLVAARFVRMGRREVGFAAAEYDRSRALVIDPQLSYSSYLGGNATDEGEKLAVDANGNAYIVGYSFSPDFPLASPLQGVNKGASSVVVSKLNPQAAGPASLVYSTYLGGSGANFGRAIAVDSQGQVYITGDTTAADFPVTPGAYQTGCKPQSSACSTDVFAAKLNASGNSLLYSTYLGGSGNEFGFAIAIDGAGHMFIGANTGSADMPVTPGAFQTRFAGGGASFGDAWVAKLNPGGQGAADLMYATYLGGSGSEQLWGLAVDGAGAICVTGSTASGNFPVTASAFRTSYSGSGRLGLGDAFAAKLNPAGQGARDLVYSTFLGGGNDDRGEGIAVDAFNRIYVTGFTESSGFPVTSANAFQPNFGGGDCGGYPCDDAFIVELDTALAGANSLVYSTFFGGSSFDLGHSIALDRAGAVYITGETASTDLPLVNPIQSFCFAGCRPLPLSDLFIAKFDLSIPGRGALLFSTYLGGGDVDTGWSIAVDSKGNALVTGQTFSSNFPTVIPFQANCNNCSSFLGSNRSGDSFLVKACITACPSASLSPGSLDFGSQNTGTTSSSQRTIFANAGSGDLTIVSIGISGSNAAEFRQTNTCPAVLTAGTYCQIDVAFTPAAVGTRVANVSITDNGGSVARSIPLSGTGVVPVAAGAPVFSPPPGSYNTPQQVTLSSATPGASIRYTTDGSAPTPGYGVVYGGAITVSATTTIRAIAYRSGMMDSAVSAATYVISTGGGGPGWYSNAWSNRKPITVDVTKVAGGSSLVDFPMLFSLAGDGDLASAAQANGNDILFTAADGVTKLNHEIESYNGATGQLTAWVQVPSLSAAANTVLYVYYGNRSAGNQQNAAGVWDASYRAVWHLPDGSRLTATDSTAAGENLTLNNGVSAAAGQIGGGANFSNGDFLSCADGSCGGSSRLDMGTSDWTTEAWIRTGATDSPILVGKLAFICGGNPDGWAMSLSGNNLFASIAKSGSDCFFATGAPVNDNNWHQAVAVWNRSGNLTLYVDGAVVGTPANISGLNGQSIVSSGIHFELGARTDAGAGRQLFYNGRMDEVRVSAVARSAGWIATEYRNQAAPAAFYSVGSQQSSGGGPVAVSAPVFSPAPGNYNTPQQVALGSATAGASIRYTTDGSAPTSAYGTFYNGAILVSATATIRAIAYRSGMTDSAVTTATYVISTGGGGPGWYNTAWSNRKPITVDVTKVAGGSNLVNFPMLFAVPGDSNLAAAAQANGNDILFTAADGVTKLNHEIESYNGATGQLTAWVQVPSLSAAANTVLYMYYGNRSASNQQNAAGVWDASYRAVWHLPDGSRLTANDSTPAGENLTLNNGVSAAAGQIGGGANFSTGDFLSCADASCGGSSRLDMGTSDWTTEAWIRTGATDGPILVGKLAFICGGNPDGWAMSLSGNNLFASIAKSGSDCFFATGVPVNDNNWHQAVAVWNRSGNLALYVDGAPAGTPTNISNLNGQSIVSSGIHFELGARTDAGAGRQLFYNGKMDEVRVSAVARSAGWIATEYRNQAAPASFYSVGPQQ